MIKNLTLTFNLWHQTKFLRELQFELTNRLFKYYLKNDYIFFLNNNSAYLYRNLTDIIGNFPDIDIIVALNLLSSLEKYR